MILLTGVSGFVGSHLVKSLCDAEIVAIGRSKPVIFDESNFLSCSIDGKGDYTSILSGVAVVIHCAARVHVMDDLADNPLELFREVNTRGTLNLARQAAEAGVKRFIFISSIKVNGELSKRNKPFTCFDRHLYEDPYGQSKSEAEEKLLELSVLTGMEVVIIRPPLVYGPGVKANFSSLMSLVSKGVPLPFGSITLNKRSLVSVRNLVDLIITCVDHPRAANQVFLVSDGHDFSTAELVKCMAKSLGVSGRMLPVPIWCYRFIGKLFGKKDLVGRLIGSLEVDIKYTTEVLGWSPPQSIQAAFEETAREFLRNKSNYK